MSERGLIYSFVSKGTVVLAEYTAFSGNFSTIAVQCLQKLPTNSNKYTYSCDGHTFNFLVDNGFVFLVVAHEAVGRGLPFTFLQRLKDEFRRSYGARIGIEGPHPLADDDNDDFLKTLLVSRIILIRNLGLPRIKQQMDYCTSHPEEISKISKIKAQMTEVKGIMMENIDKIVVYLMRSLILFQVLERGEKIEVLVDKTENLQFQVMCSYYQPFLETWNMRKVD
ncbi:hypothetical protein IFM89_031028 [Coptis chinensis]|uniref:Longin domain-containing protein n=1 Tax=Coptis chinensis TaxID=261450 RepID=A0A835H863_9MAGN|nr:hypothetical protein IFM89_031028 [Coptis chinensis]